MTRIDPKSQNSHRCASLCTSSFPFEPGVPAEEGVALRVRNEGLPDVPHGHDDIDDARAAVRHAGIQSFGVSVNVKNALSSGMSRSSRQKRLYSLPYESTLGSTSRFHVPPTNKSTQITKRKPKHQPSLWVILANNSNSAIPSNQIIFSKSTHSGPHAPSTHLSMSRSS